jgi:hypothetical protein
MLKYCGVSCLGLHILLIDLLGRYARVVDHLAVKDVAQGAPLGGGSTLHHLARCTALSSRTECERYWEARTKKMMEN